MDAQDHVMINVLALVRQHVQLHVIQHVADNVMDLLLHKFQLIYYTMYHII